jgi:hypothetical protein
MKIKFPNLKKRKDTGNKYWEKIIKQESRKLGTSSPLPLMPFVVMEPQDVPGDGNCFYRSVAEALDFHGLTVPESACNDARRNANSNNNKNKDKNRNKKLMSDVAQCLRVAVARSIESDPENFEMVRKKVRLTRALGVNYNLNASTAIDLFARTYPDTWATMVSKSAVKRMAAIIGSTSAYASEIEVAVVRKWLQQNHDTDLVVMTRASLEEKTHTNLIASLQKVQYPKTMVLMVDREHYNWVKVTYMSGKSQVSKAIMDTAALVLILSADAFNHAK